jgi:LacI family transcriptional regulator
LKIRGVILKVTDFTIKDIAKRAEVSTATVSRALNNSGYVGIKTKEKIRSIAKELNYVPNVMARNLSKSESNVVGVVVPEITNPFFGEVIKGITSTADKNNLSIILYSTDEAVHKELRCLQLLKEQRVQGLVLTTSCEDENFNSMHLKALQDLGIPIVLMDRDVKYSNFDAVFFDDIHGAYLGVDALIKAGHRKIAALSGPTVMRPGRDRLRGYKKAFFMNNIPLDESYIFYGEHNMESGYKETKEILQMKEPPTAIFATNNMVCLGCMKALCELGIRIPQDIALVGFDQIETFDILNLKISVVFKDTEKMGKTAMELLLEKLNDKEGERHTKRVILPTEIKLKGSEIYIR